METIKNFIKKWGGFIALSLVAITSLIVFIISEAKCDSALLRILTGLITMPLFTFANCGAVMSFVENKIK